MGLGQNRYSGDTEVVGEGVCVCVYVRGMSHLSASPVLCVDIKVKVIRSRARHLRFKSCLCHLLVVDLKQVTVLLCTSIFSSIKWG